MALGASTVRIVGILVILMMFGVGGWLAHSHYQLLGRIQKVQRSLDIVHRYRGTHRVTRPKIQAKALALLKAAGGRVESRDITLTLSQLTLDNSHELPRMVRTKLSLRCHMKKLSGVRDHKIARIKRRFESAHRRPVAAPTRPAPPIGQPDLSGAVGCSSARLAELDYTFVLLRAKVSVRSGMLRRTITVTRKFFLPQPPTDPNADEDDSDDDDINDD